MLEEQYRAQLTEERKGIDKEIFESQAKKGQFLSYKKMANSLLYLIIFIFIVLYVRNLIYTGFFHYLGSGAGFDAIMQILLGGFVIKINKSYVNIANMLYIFILLYLLKAFFVARVNYWDSKIAAIDRRRKEIKMELEVQASYFERLVRINLDNLSEYYDLVQAHTDKSFEATRLASILGVGLIFAGLIIGWSDFDRNATITYISAGTGIIIEFISGIFFYLYNKTVTQLKEYHDSLLDVQNILLSFKIVEDMKEEQVKAKNIENMICYLIGDTKSPIKEEP